MKDITEIYCVGIKPPASVKFKSKLMTILLSPVTNGVMTAIILAFIALIFIILTVFWFVVLEAKSATGLIEPSSNII